MTNNELLLAISDMMDTKLRAELQPLRNEMKDFKDEMRNEMQDFRGEMQSEMQDFRGEMQSEMQDFRGEMQSEMQDFRGEMQSGMQDFRGEMRSEMQDFKDEMQSGVHQIKLFQENIILPRLDTIESCYLDTYRRYRDNADRMEAVFEDVGIMKKVLAEHSKQLQKLA
jgi:gas vesicle protein